MKINSIAQNARPTSFKALYATTSTKNFGDCVDNEVIKPFKSTSKQIADSPLAQEFVPYRYGSDRIDAYVLMAGAGTRFANLAHKISPQHTKISFGTPILNEEGAPTNKKMHAADFQLAMASVFADEDGVQRINADTARGSFAEIMTNALKLRAEGKPQNNVLLMCGDNNFDINPDDPYELMRFITECVDNPDVKMALFGAEREPEEVVKKFGVLKVAPTEQDDVLQLQGFVEKPATVEIAKEFATPDGTCLANTGMVYYSKEAMEYIVDKVLEQPDFVAKNEKEPYDFAFASQRVLENYPQGCVVKAVGTWEDMGEPKALYSTLDEIKDGCFIGALPKKTQKAIVNSLNQVYDGKSLLLSSAAIEKFKTASNLTQQIERGLDVNDANVAVDNIEGVNVASDKLDFIG